MSTTAVLRASAALPGTKSKQQGAGRQSDRGMTQAMGCGTKGKGCLGGADGDGKMVEVLRAAQGRKDENDHKQPPGETKNELPR